MTLDQSPLTVAQAAQMSGLSPSTLKRRITTKALPARYSTTGTWLIERADLMAFLSAHDPSRAVHAGASRSGASGHGPSTPAHGRVMGDPMGEPELVMVEHLSRSLERERQLNADLQRTNEELRAQNKELHGEVLKLSSEMLALLKGDGKGLLSRWIRK
jgi:hypothetical protein